MGKAKGNELMQGLAKQDLAMPGSSSVMRVQLMLAGESAIAIAARGRRVSEYKQQGAPIDYRVLDPYAGEPNFVTLMQRAPHPFAAVLFIDWMLSEEGRDAHGRGRALIRAPRHQAPRLGAGAISKRFRVLSPSSIGPNLNDIIDQYNRTFRRAAAREVRPKFGSVGRTLRRGSGRSGR